MVRTKESGKMKALRLIGFFRDLPHGRADAASLAQSMGDTPGPCEKEIVEYLRGGTLFIASPGLMRDVLDGSGPIGTGSVYTDGVWAWSDDLAHYIERYHVILPEEFLEHARRNDWKAPAIATEQLRRLALP